MNTKHKKKQKYGSNYVSIVHPTNNFNFGSLNDLETKAETEKILQLHKQSSPRSKHQQERVVAPTIALDLNKKIYKKSSNINMNQLQFQKTSFQQKLQDMYFQIHKPKNISQYNVKPAKMNFYSGGKTQIGLNYLSSFNESPRKKKENYFANVYKMVSSHTSKITNKEVVDKINKIMKTTNPKGGSYVTNKKTTKLNSIIGQKLEGLNQMLHSKVDEYKIVNNGGNILNEDDFITLEDKMKLFQTRKSKKSSSGSKAQELSDIKEQTNLV